MKAAGNFEPMSDILFRYVDAYGGGRVPRIEPLVPGEGIQKWNKIPRRCQSCGSIHITSSVTWGHEVLECANCGYVNISKESSRYGWFPRTGQLNSGENNDI